MGMTFLAAAASIPEGITSIILIKKGILWFSTNMKMTFTLLMTVLCFIASRFRIYGNCHSCQFGYNVNSTLFVSSLAYTYNYTRSKH